MQAGRTMVTVVAALALSASTALAQGAAEVKLKEEKAGLMAKAKISFEVAKASAQAKVPAGKLVSAELEEEGGKLIYTLVYKTAGKKGQDEVNVDAVTGSVAPIEHESAETAGKEEAAEKAKGTPKDPAKVPAKKKP